MSYNVDLEQIAKSLISELKPEITNTFKERFKKEALLSITPYFMNRHDKQKFIDNPSLTTHYGVNKNNIKDIGYAKDFIDNVVTEQLLSEENKKFMEDYIKRNFKTFLTKSLDESMTHHARKVSFEMTEQAVSKLTEKE